MSRAIPLGDPLRSALEAEGLVPRDCRQLELVIPTDGLLVLRYEVALPVDVWAQLARAFTAAATAHDRPPDKLPPRQPDWIR